eukprot:Clim_evm20s195 gene=Clim_evmTU20s195
MVPDDEKNGKPEVGMHQFPRATDGEGRNDANDNGNTGDSRLGPPLAHRELERRKSAPDQTTSHIVNAQNESGPVVPSIHIEGRQHEIQNEDGQPKSALQTEVRFATTDVEYPAAPLLGDPSAEKKPLMARLRGLSISGPSERHGVLRRESTSASEEILKRRARGFSLTGVDGRGALGRESQSVGAAPLLDTPDGRNISQARRASQSVFQRMRRFTLGNRDNARSRDAQEGMSEDEIDSISMYKVKQILLLPKRYESLTFVQLHSLAHLLDATIKEDFPRFLERPIEDVQRVMARILRVVKKCLLKLPSTITGEDDAQDYNDFLFAVYRMVSSIANIRDRDILWVCIYTLLAGADRVHCDELLGYIEFLLDKVVAQLNTTAQNLTKTASLGDTLVRDALPDHDVDHQRERLTVVASAIVSAATSRLDHLSSLRTIVWRLNNLDVPTGIVLSKCMGEGTFENAVKVLTLMNYFWPCRVLDSFDEGYLQDGPEKRRMAVFNKRNSLCSTGSPVTDRRTLLSKLLGRLRRHLVLTADRKSPPFLTQGDLAKWLSMESNADIVSNPKEVLALMIEDGCVFSLIANQDHDDPDVMYGLRNRSTRLQEDDDTTQQCVRLYNLFDAHSPQEAAMMRSSTAAIIGHFGGRHEFLDYTVNLVYFLGAVDPNFCREDEVYSIFKAIMDWWCFVMRQMFKSDQYSLIPQKKVLLTDDTSRPDRIRLVLAQWVRRALDAFPNMINTYASYIKAVEEQEQWESVFHNVKTDTLLTNKLKEVETESMQHTTFFIGAMVHIVKYVDINKDVLARTCFLFLDLICTRPHACTTHHTFGRMSRCPCAQPGMGDSRSLFEIFFTFCLDEEVDAFSFCSDEGELKRNLDVLRVLESMTIYVPITAYEALVRTSDPEPEQAIQIADLMLTNLEATGDTIGKKEGWNFNRIISLVDGLLKIILEAQEDAGNLANFSDINRDSLDQKEENGSRSLYFFQSFADIACILIEYACGLPINLRDVGSENVPMAVMEGSHESLRRPRVASMKRKVHRKSLHLTGNRIPNSGHLSSSTTERGSDGSGTPPFTSPFPSLSKLGELPSPRGNDSPHASAAGEASTLTKKPSRHLSGIFRGITGGAYPTRSPLGRNYPSGESDSDSIASTPTFQVTKCFSEDLEVDLSNHAVTRIFADMMKHGNAVVKTMVLSTFVRLYCESSDIADPAHIAPASSIDCIANLWSEDTPTDSIQGTCIKIFTYMLQSEAEYYASTQRFYSDDDVNVDDVVRGLFVLGNMLTILPISDTMTLTTMGKYRLGGLFNGLSLCITHRVVQIRIVAREAIDLIPEEKMKFYLSHWASRLSCYDNRMFQTETESDKEKGKMASGRTSITSSGLDSSGASKSTTPITYQMALDQNLVSPADSSNGGGMLKLPPQALHQQLKHMITFQSAFPQYVVCPWQTILSFMLQASQRPVGEEATSLSHYNNFIGLVVKLALRQLAHQHLPDNMDLFVERLVQLLGFNTEDLMSFEGSGDMSIGHQQSGEIVSQASMPTTPLQKRRSRSSTFAMGQVLDTDLPRPSHARRMSVSGDRALPSSPLTARKGGTSTDQLHPASRRGSISGPPVHLEGDLSVSPLLAELLKSKRIGRVPSISKSASNTPQPQRRSSSMEPAQARSRNVGAGGDSPYSRPRRMSITQDEVIRERRTSIILDTALSQPRTSAVMERVVQQHLAQLSKNKSETNLAEQSTKALKRRTGGITLSGDQIRQSSSATSKRRASISSVNMLIQRQGSSRTLQNFAKHLRRPTWQISSNRVREWVWRTVLLDFPLIFDFSEEAATYLVRPCLYTLKALLGNEVMPINQCLVEFKRGLRSLSIILYRYEMTNEMDQKVLDEVVRTLLARIRSEQASLEYIVEVLCVFHLVIELQPRLALEMVSDVLMFSGACIFVGSLPGNRQSTSTIRRIASKLIEKTMEKYGQVGMLHLLQRKNLDFDVMQLPSLGNYKDNVWRGEGVQLDRGDGTLMRTLPFTNLPVNPNFMDVLILVMSDSEDGAGRLLSLCQHSFEYFSEVQLHHESMSITSEELTLFFLNQHRLVDWLCNAKKVDLKPLSELVRSVCDQLCEYKLGIDYRNPADLSKFFRIIASLEMTTPEYLVFQNRSARHFTHTCMLYYTFDEDSLLMLFEAYQADGIFARMFSLHLVQMLKDLVTNVEYSTRPSIPVVVTTYTRSDRKVLATLSSHYSLLRKFADRGFFALELRKLCIDLLVRMLDTRVISPKDVLPAFDERTKTTELILNLRTASWLCYSTALQQNAPIGARLLASQSDFGDMIVKLLVSQAYSDETFAVSFQGQEDRLASLIGQTEDERYFSVRLVENATLVFSEVFCFLKIFTAYHELQDRRKIRGGQLGQQVHPAVLPLWLRIWPVIYTLLLGTVRQLNAQHNLWYHWLDCAVTLQSFHSHLVLYMEPVWFSLIEQMRRQLNRDSATKGLVNKLLHQLVKPPAKPSDNEIIAKFYAYLSK